MEMFKSKVTLKPQLDYDKIFKKGTGENIRTRLGSSFVRTEGATKISDKTF